MNPQINKGESHYAVRYKLAPFNQRPILRSDAYFDVNANSAVLIRMSPGPCMSIAWVPALIGGNTVNTA